MKNRTLKSFFLLLLFMVLFPLNSFAAGITSSSYNASENLFYVYMDLTGVQSFNVLHEPTGKYASYTAGSQNYITLNCNGKYTFTFYNSSSASMGSDSVTSSGILNENAVCGADSPAPEEPAPGGTCDSCAIMECPGWGEYMGKLDDIQAAIPPPPNWGAVADTFRDSIAPQVKQDMADVIGVTASPAAPNYPSAPSAPSAPSQPSSPSQPSAPAQPDSLDDGGLTAPTGQEAPGLGDSSFTSGDIKDEAPAIEVNEDPTGGFTINDPTVGLPSQDEFIENAENMPPYNPDNPLPEIPPYVPDNPAPAAPPYDPVSPLPTMPEYDPSNPAPTAPEYDPNTPFPEAPVYDPVNPAPDPGDYGGNYDIPPIPGQSDNTAPMPGSETGTAPTPGG